MIYFEAKKALGISQETFTLAEAKSAYRRRIHETHPDKNPSVPKEKATAAFQQVVEAWEFFQKNGTTAPAGATGGSSAKGGPFDDDLCAAAAAAGIDLDDLLYFGGRSRRSR